ncbi:hypothetical protein [Weissella viridescens]|uniref:Uncharacterized protein n=1 Tax=Weissella viridescens TaxID=1629 RepID=A0A380P1M6_WEIVI|nr:hypothetical protein [Weissella viridescens]SUP59111.1 Uncharacterised protein [Weissella viridescens]
MMQNGVHQSFGVYGVMVQQKQLAVIKKQMDLTKTVLIYLVDNRRQAKL